MVRQAATVMRMIAVAPPFFRGFMRLAGMLAVVAGAGCFAGSDYSTQWRGQIVVEDGIPTVVNPLEPMIDTGTAVAIRRWTVPDSADLRDRQPWAVPNLISVSREWIYVADRRAHSVYQISWAGDWTRTIGGRQGQGPGELDGPGSVTTANGEVFIGQSAFVHVFRESDGAFQRALRVPTPPLFSVRRYSDSVLVVSSYGGRNFMSVNGEFSDIPGEPARLPGRGARTPAPPCSRGYDGASVRLAADCYLLRVSVLNDSGKPTRQFRIDRDTLRATRAELDSLRAANYAVVGGEDKVTPEIRGFIERDIEPRRARLSVAYVVSDSSSGLIAIVEGSAATRGTTVHFLNGSGVYLAQQRFSGRLTDMVFTNSTLLALVAADDTGEVTSVAYDVQIPRALLRFDPRG
jgi:hypothetical protein